MFHENLPLSIKGHVKIVDDLGNVLLEQDNAVHPQNMARIIARALSKEGNYYINRIAFGNGGTSIDAAFNITFKPPNDGQPPDIQTWESRLYNETYSEIIDDSSPDLGKDLGSAGPRVGTRPGGGAQPADDPISVQNVSGPGVRSRELGLTSDVLAVAVLNPNEPVGQFKSDQSLSNINSPFTFDEIGIFTTGKQAAAKGGSQDIDTGLPNGVDVDTVTTLIANNTYNFSINVDGEPTPTLITVTVPEFITPTFGDLVDGINNGTGTDGWLNQALPGLTTVAVTDNAAGIQTFGFLRFFSGTTGDDSSISLTDGNQPDGLFANVITGGAAILPAEQGSAKGVQNNATVSGSEQERLLTHLVFAPVIKTANRTLTVTYTLTVSVARTQS